MRPTFEEREINEMRVQERTIDWHRLLALIPPVVAFAAVSACSFDVTNPGPTQDKFLDSLNAHEAVVIGARERLGTAMQEITYWGAVMANEINPAGSTGSYGIPTYIQDGRFTDGDGGDYGLAAQARWVAEDAYRRFERVLPDIPGAPAIGSYELAAEALLYAGYANRLLGENFCQVTFDGGPLSPNTDAFTRAEGHFTNAMTIATAAGASDVAMAAQAGRASVRADLATYGLANWSDAASDAAAIADNAFVFAMPYSTQDQDQQNYIFTANAGVPYRAHTIWATFWHEYYKGTNDPRTPWIVGSVATGDAAVSKFHGLGADANDRVPWYPQQKFDTGASPINLSSGWEMRLIEAEAALAGGNFAAANGFMNQRINALNTGGATIAVAAATSVAEGYAKLYLERGAELWLEGRRMGDLRRWIENATPGAPQAANTAGAFPDGTYLDLDGDGIYDQEYWFVVDNHRGYPLGRGEREVNPNVSFDVVFCTAPN